MTAVLTENEIERTRIHLGYGAIGIGGYPWTPDGYFELFHNVTAEYLSTAEETTATTAITANSVTVVTPVSMTGITTNERLFIDVADDVEIVTVKAVTATTFTARFLKAHTTAGYPISVDSGVPRLRYLLYQADLAWADIISGRAGKSAGLKSLAREEIVWFGPYAVLRGVMDQYLAVVGMISRLLRVEAVEMPGSQCHRVEAY